MLSVSGLVARYRDLVALEGIQIEARTGEVTAVVGPNGAGKSTLLAAISGLVPQCAGSVRYDGRELLGMEAHRIVDMGVVHIPEGRRLFPFMSVEENLEMGAYSARARAERDATLERVYGLLPRLRERRQQLAHTLSGGEQQMCAIGRGLMAKPALLMLDEPTLGLAPMVCNEVFELISSIRAQGITILIVEQQVARVLKLADRAYVIETGRLRMQGTGAELLHDDALRRAYLSI